MGFFQNNSADSRMMTVQVSSLSYNHTTMIEVYLAVCLICALKQKKQTIFCVWYNYSQNIKTIWQHIHISVELEIFSFIAFFHTSFETLGDGPSQGGTWLALYQKCALQALISVLCPSLIHNTMVDVTMTSRMLPRLSRRIIHLHEVQPELNRPIEFC